ncbi:MAG TPA: metalloregulator ArsR/SmtB family transcription factor [Roseiflexaceae bacterium]|nr:metalloregulator ArsR/SmtB family transcription factor [Roseiflexaceae bacterium]
MPPSLETDLVARTPAASLRVALEPAQNILNSLTLLTAADKFSGLDDWVTRTAADMTPTERHRNTLVIEGLHFAVVPDRSWPSFTAYLDDLAARDPVALRDRLLRNISRACVDKTPAGAEPAHLADPEALLSSADAYIRFLQDNFFEFDLAIETEAHALFSDPPRMKDLIVSHLNVIWEARMSAEWDRVQPLLQESVAAFQQIDLRRMSGFEAIRLVTGQEPHEKWQKWVANSRQIIFVPSAHLGPYLRSFKEEKLLWILFGARLPEGASAGPSALSRSDLLVRLNALTDDTRLRILALLAQQDELCAQDIMAQLDLNQSAASRHLRQLSAAGYITERRRDVAKCYTLNRERIGQTFRALDRFLTRP